MSGDQALTPTDLDTGPPDDAPVTWGDLRRIAALLYTYQSNVTMMTVMGLGNALGRDATPEQQEIEKNASDAAERYEQQLMALLKGPPK